MGDENDKKDELLRLLTEAEETHSKAQQEAHELVEMIQAGRDRARFTRDALRTFPMESGDVERQVIVWRRQNDAARVIGANLREIGTDFGVTFNSTAYGTSTVSMQMFEISNQHPSPEATKVLQQLQVLQDRAPVLKNLRTALGRCGLDRPRGGNRSPLSLIDDAEHAVSGPPGSETSPTGALLNLREGIGRAIQDVLARCQGNQEEAGSWSAKVLSVGRRCASARVPTDHFKGLAESVEARIKRLSGAKDRAMSRDDVLLLHYDGLSFLLTFLDGVDESRLRP